MSSLRRTFKKQPKVHAALRELVLGENNNRQFKCDVTNSDELAADMAAFANSAGGTIYLGVDNDGSTPGFSAKDVQRLNPIISNTANELVSSPITVFTQNILLPNGRIVIALNVPEGVDKPHFDRQGVVWLKSGADKRRVDSKAELRHLLQANDHCRADELPTKASIDAIDRKRLRDFLQSTSNKALPSQSEDLRRLLANMKLATVDGALNLAGLLLFVEQPQVFKPQFGVKAVKYPGTKIHASRYDDTEDLSGPFRRVFDDALGFVRRNLHTVEAGRGNNRHAAPEITVVIFEELLVNALVHRDYLISAPIRLFVFDDRIEILSPGTLPNNLTLENIRSGVSNLRNPILASYVAKGILPYRGLGSGISRALEEWPDIDFNDDRDRGLFIATVRQKNVIARAELRQQGD